MSSLPQMERTTPFSHDTLGSALDPRVAVLAVVVVDAFLLSVGTEFIEIIGTLIACVCLVSSQEWKSALAVAIIELFILAFIHFVHIVGGSPASTMVIFALTFTFRFILAGIIAVRLIGGLTTGQVQALLRWSRVPRFFAVPVMVALRFFPVVVDDARTITENLILRGLIASKVSLLWHPVVGVRHAVLPLVASSLRSGDELSASALLRGLGATSTPTAVVRLRLRRWDLLTLALIIAVALFGLYELGVFTWLS